MSGPQALKFEYPKPIQFASVQAIVGNLPEADKLIASFNNTQAINTIPAPKAIQATDITTALQKAQSDRVEKLCFLEGVKFLQSVYNHLQTRLIDGTLQLFLNQTSTLRSESEKHLTPQRSWGDWWNGISPEKPHAALLKELQIRLTPLDEQRKAEDGEIAAAALFYPIVSDQPKKQQELIEQRNKAEQYFHQMLQLRCLLEIPYIDTETMETEIKRCVDATLAKRTGVRPNDFYLNPDFVEKTFDPLFKEAFSLLLRAHQLAYLFDLIVKVHQTASSQGIGQELVNTAMDADKQGFKDPRSQFLQDVAQYKTNITSQMSKIDADVQNARTQVNHANSPNVRRLLLNQLGQKETDVQTQVQFASRQIKEADERKACLQLLLDSLEAASKQISANEQKISTPPVTLTAAGAAAQ